jgi:hypothetical protein
MKLIFEQNHDVNPKRPALAASTNGKHVGKRGRYPYKYLGASFPFHGKEEATDGNISVPKVGNISGTQKCKL